MTDRKFTPPTSFPAKYVTRDGQEAVVEKTFEEGPYHLRGKVGCKSRSWMRSGAYWLDGDDHAYDLFDLPEEQPIEERYPVGVWHGWTGGECPLPEGTEGHVKLTDGAEHFCFNLAGADYWPHLVIAFCVTSYPKPEPKTHEVWLNLYNEGEAVCHPSREAADADSFSRIARKRITITEGEWGE